MSVNSYYDIFEFLEQFLKSQNLEDTTSHLENNERINTIIQIIEKIYPDILDLNLHLPFISLKTKLIEAGKFIQTKIYSPVFKKYARNLRRIKSTKRKSKHHKSKLLKSKSRKSKRRKSKRHKSKRRKSKRHKYKSKQRNKL